MDTRCTALYKMGLHEDFELIFNHGRGFPNYFSLPKKCKEYCIFLACSSYIINNHIDRFLHTDHHFDTSSKNRFTNPIIVGIKPLKEERYHTDIASILAEKQYLIYVDCAAIVSRNITHPSLRTYVDVCNVMKYNWCSHTSIYRLLYQDYKTSRTYVKTFENVSNAIDFIYELYSVIEFYKSDMARTLAYCMLSNANLYEGILLNAIKECNLDYNYILSNRDTLLRQIRG
jgi:hypothetical protein